MQVEGLNGRIALLDGEIALLRRERHSYETLESAVIQNLHDEIDALQSRLRQATDEHGIPVVVSVLAHVFLKCLRDSTDQELSNVSKRHLQEVETISVASRQQLVTQQQQHDSEFARVSAELASCKQQLSMLETQLSTAKAALDQSLKQASDNSKVALQNAESRFSSGRLSSLWC